MRGGDYRIQVHILEAKDIKLKKTEDVSAGMLRTLVEGETADPMVEVSLAYWQL